MNEYTNYTREGLYRLQHWFEGFEAAGGKLPPTMQPFSSLRKAIRILDETEMFKVYAMASDGGDGSMSVSLFESIEACQYAENEDPETYRAESYYREVYVTSMNGVHTMNSLIEEYSYDLSEVPLGTTGPCTLALP